MIHPVVVCLLIGTFQLVDRSRLIEYCNDVLVTLYNDSVLYDSNLYTLLTLAVYPIWLLLFNVVNTKISTIVVSSDHKTN